MSSLKIILPKGSLLIRYQKTKRNIPINGKINLNKYQKHMYFTWISKKNSNDLIIKKLDFIEKYGPYAEYFITNQDISLLDLPYTTINTEENTNAPEKIRKIYNNIIKAIQNENSNNNNNGFSEKKNSKLNNNIIQFQAIFKELFGFGYNSELNNKLKNIPSYNGRQVNYNFQKYFNKLNLNGWIRTSIISPEASEVMLVSKNVKDKIIRIN